ncbi:unnamed protein product [Musa textilis]
MTSTEEESEVDVGHNDRTTINPVCYFLLGFFHYLDAFITSHLFQVDIFSIYFFDTIFRYAERIWNHNLFYHYTNSPPPLS